MSIKVRCNNCDSRFKVADAMAGKTGKCPKCQSVLHVPDVPVRTRAEEEWDVEMDELPSGLPPRMGDAKRNIDARAKEPATKSYINNAAAGSGHMRIGLWFGGAGLVIAGIVATGILFLRGGGETDTPVIGDQLQDGETEPTESTADSDPARETAVVVDSEPELVLPIVTKPGTPAPFVAAPHVPEQEVPSDRSRVSIDDLVVVEFPQPALRLWMTSADFDPITGMFIWNRLGKIVGFKPEFFAGDSSAVIAPNQATDRLVVMSFVKRFEDRTVILMLDGDNNIHELDPTTLEIVRSAAIETPRKPEPRYVPPVQEAAKRPDVYNIMASTSDPADPFVYLLRVPSEIKAPQAMDLRTFTMTTGQDVKDRINGNCDTLYGRSTIDRWQFVEWPNLTIDRFHRYIIWDREFTDLSMLGYDEPRNPLSARRMDAVSATIQPRNLDFHVAGTAGNGRWIIGVQNSPVSADSPRKAGATGKKATTTSGVQLCFVSPQTLDTLAHIEIPNPEVPLNPQPGASPTGDTAWPSGSGKFQQVRVFDDPPRRRFILGNGGWAMAVPYDLEGIPDVPLLAATVSHVKATPGEKLSVDIQPAESGTEVELVTGPTMLSIEGTSLVWTPTPEEIGPVDVVVNLKKGSHTARDVIRLNVEHPSLNWNGDSDRGFFQISPDGRLGLAVSYPPSYATFPRWAVFDLKKRHLIVERELDHEVHWADIGRHHVVGVAELRDPQSDFQLLVCSTASLDIQQTRSTRSRGIEMVNDQFIYAASIINNERQSVHETLLQDLKVPPDEAPKSIGYAHSTPRFAGEFAAGYLKDGLLRSPRGEIQLLAGIPNVLSPKGFGLYVDRGGIGNANGPRRALTIDPLVYEPSSVELRVDRTMTGARNGREEQTLELVAKDLKTGDIVRRWSILREPAHPDSIVSSSLAIHGDTAWVMLRGRIHPVSVVDLPRKPRLSITPRQSRFDVRPKGRTTLQYEITGGRQPLTAVLEFIDVYPDRTHVVDSLSHKPGEFNVDGAELNRLILKNCKPGIGDQFEMFGQDHVPWIETYQESAASVIESLTKVKTSDVPFLTTARITATDADGDSVELQHQVLIEIPAAEIKRLLIDHSLRYQEAHGNK